MSAQLNPAILPVISLGIKREISQIKISEHLFKDLSMLRQTTKPGERIVKVG